MASLALGAIGGFFFGPIGFMIGSALGSLLFPGKGPDGPRLSDLKLQGSSYGQMIPIVYGTDRLSGQAIWQTDLVEHTHKSGGKGGPTVTTYSYTVSFAVKICKGPMGGIVRIWADSTIIYDTTAGATTDNSQVPITVYLGNESAGADPTIEAAEGVGNVPAFRDDMVVVFTDWDVSQFGNRIPTISWEVFAAGGAIPWRVSTWNIPQTVVAPAVQVGLENGLILVGQYTESVDAMTYTLDSYQIDGTHVAQIDNIASPGFSHVSTYFPAQNDPRIAFCRAEQSGSTGDVSAWYVEGALSGNPVGGGPGVDPYFAIAQDQDVFVTLDKSKIYAISGTGNGQYVTRYEMTGGNPDIGVTNYATLPGGSYKYKVAVDSMTGNVYVQCAHVSTDTFLNIYDADLNLIQTCANGTLPADFKIGWTNFAVYNNIICICGPHNGVGLTLANAFQVDGTYMFPYLGGTQVTTGNFADLGNGLVAVYDGIISLNAPPGSAILGDIVKDQSVRAGLTTAMVDTSALTQLVPGFIVSRQAACKENILPLQTAYFFDGVESSGQMKFVNRGGLPVVTIPDSDLAAQTPGSTAPPLLTIKRTQEVDIPYWVNVTYQNVDAWYQDGTQYAFRQTTQSQSTANVQLAIAMGDSKAKQVAAVLLWSSWIEREGMIGLLPRKYSYLEPTDVISARGYTLRVDKKSDVASGIIQLDCVVSLPTLYTIAPVANATQGGQQTYTGTSQLTQLQLLDIPLVVDADNPDGIYAAMAGATTPTPWKGVTLYKSIDAGTTYDSVLVATDPTTIGLTTTALADWTGGNFFDEANSVTVTVGLGGGTLSSATELAVLNGANKALIGVEILQYKNAVLVSGSTYTLSGLLRGRRGTEWATSTHKIGERFIALPADDVPLAFAELAQSRMYKTTTIGSSTSSTAVTFTDMGAREQPYAPVQLAGGLVNTGGDVALTWVRRTRVGGAWSDYVDVPLAQQTESYIVQIWDATYSLCARIILVGATQTTTYTSAQQVTDFGANQKNIYFSVAQVGSFTLGSQAYGVAPGTGGSNNNPTAPIAPYVTIPNVPVPGTTHPVDYTLSYPSGSQQITIPIGQTTVFGFTTLAATPQGSIAVNVLNPSGTYARARICTDTGGLSEVGGTTQLTTINPTVTWGGSNTALSSLTTYYFILDHLYPNGQISGVPGAAATIIVALTASH